jgi:hypothetical protein
MVVSDPRGRCALIGDDSRSCSGGTLKGVDTRCRRFPYPICAEDVRSVKSGVVCAPKVRLNGIKAVVSKLSYTEACCTEALSLLAGEYRSTAVFGDTEIPTCVDDFFPAYRSCCEKWSGYPQVPDWVNGT